MDTTDIMLYAGYLLTVLGAIVAIILPLIQSISDPKSLVKTVAGAILIGGIFLIAYSTADGYVSPKFAAEPFNLTETGSKSVGGMLITTYALFVIAIVGIVITEITKLAK